MRLSSVCLVVLLFSVPLYAASPSPSDENKTQIADVVHEISAKSIEATIKKLVGFGTRHTLSETASKTRGIGAAREWIRSEFARYSSDSGGRLQVTMDEFTEPPGPRN